jgi:hypothetical protein
MERMSAISGHSEVVRIWNIAFCKVFGIEPNQVRSIALQIEPNDVIVATVKLYVQEGQMKRLATLVKKLTVKEE